MGLNVFFAFLMLFAANGAGGNQTDVRFHVGELEVVSVSDDSLALSWYTSDPTRHIEPGRPWPVPADTVVRYGTSADPTTWETVVLDEPATAYHHVEVTGLEPDTPYWVEASSKGVRATGTVFGLQTVRSPASVRTLPRPEGDILLTVAVGNDTHVGESVSGLLVNGFPPGFGVDPENPYSRFSFESFVADAVASGADAVVVNGDMTAEARPAEVAEAAAILRGVEDLGVAVLPVRGNHDRAHEGVEYESCTPVPFSPTHRDCFDDVFAGVGPGAAFNRVVDLGPVRLVAVDSNDVLTGYGDIAAETLAWLDAELDSAGSDRVLVFLHHTATFESVRSWFPWPGFLLPDEDIAALQSVVAGHDDKVLAVFSGHTHRNKRTSGAAQDVVFQEIAAVKEYMSGYGLLEIREGGMVYQFRETTCASCREWAERTRRQYFGFYPIAVQGKLSDRSFSVSFGERIPVGSGDRPE